MKPLPEQQMEDGIVPTNFVAFVLFTIHGSNLPIDKPQKRRGL
jgi:hypothetical protein